jgi:soluble lytic murein transglycosylase-like protein
LIDKYAAETELPAALIAAVMWQESGGDPDAYSYSGAVGLLQVMPRDGIAEGFGVFGNRPTINELQDPEFNVKYGTGMLAGLVNKYGSYRDALLHYGPMNVGYYYADKVLAIYNVRK